MFPYFNMWNRNAHSRVFEKSLLRLYNYLEGGMLKYHQGCLRLRRSRRSPPRTCFVWVPYPLTPWLPSATLTRRAINSPKTTNLILTRDPGARGARRRTAGKTTRRFMPREKVPKQARLFLPGLPTIGSAPRPAAAPHFPRGARIPPLRASPQTAPHLPSFPRLCEGRRYRGGGSQRAKRRVRDELF